MPLRIQFTFWISKWHLDADSVTHRLLTPEDDRALNLLFHSHINPYGLFPLDLLKSLGITQDFLVNDGARIETAGEQEEDLAELLYA